LRSSSLLVIPHHRMCRSIAKPRRETYHSRGFLDGEDEPQQRANRAAFEIGAIGRYRDRGVVIARETGRPIRFDTL
jgi:hypothetical protein